MEIVPRNVEELIFAEYNPRQLTAEQHKTLTDSVKRFGLVDPILVNVNSERKDVIVGGHQRVTVAKQLGFKEVPTVELDLTPEKERELNIRLNRNTGEWDWDALANHFDMDDLHEWGFTDNQLTGFATIDYSVLDDDDVDLDSFKEGTRKAIQIEFKLEDYQEATTLVNNLREKEEYVGGIILDFLRRELGV